ncbi:GntR family transcriptional regulator [Streptomyces sp. AcH 505]|uniref:winged helix-turn-helix domain-containing protein n=1 Tax=Streptomyces sp. AcH 505 TaxID=352211 RepID=UPI0005921CE3|nr:GntR family transcriptional regulator [Streptomyces sp. AcH 505]
MTFDRSAPDGTGRPTSDDVAKVLRQRIDDGVIAVGAALPTQAALAEEFGVQRGVIRQAVRLLQRDGLLTEVTRGAPPRIAGRGIRREAVAGMPQETLVALGPRINDAFAATDVRIDALCLTAESLSAALGEQRRLIHERAAAPSTVTVRVLLPNRDIDLAFPRMVDNPNDRDPVHRRWLRQRNSHGSVLRDHLLGLGAAHDIDIDIQFRAMPFTPPVKLYLLNGSEALFAYYRVQKREEQINATAVEMFDAIGGESPLFAFRADELERDRAFVTQSQAWFNALWQTIATDLALD